MVTPVTRPKAQGYGALVGDKWYRVVPSGDLPANVFTRDSLAERQDDRANPDENVLDIGHAFSFSNLTGGEGLDTWPRPVGEERQRTDDIRFWASADLVIERPDQGQPYKIVLAPQAEVWWTPGLTPVDAASSINRLYVAAGDTVYRFDSLNDTTPEDTDDINVTLVQIDASMDNAVAALDVNGDIWYKAPTTETYLKVYDSAADGPMLDAKAIWLVKGRIIAYCRNTSSAGDGIMLEIAPVITGTPGTPTEGAHTFTTVDTFAAVMLDCVDAGHALVASFDDGSLRSYVPQTDTAGGAPDLTIRARTTVPRGEVAYRLAWNAGILLLFTTDTNNDHARVYTSSVLDVRFDYVVGNMQLLRTWHASVETQPAYCANAVATRDAIYFWVGEAASDYNCWRFDLVSQGLTRERADSWASKPLGTVVMEDVLVYIQGSSLYRDAQDYKASGYLITPNINFGLHTAINWSSFVIEATHLEGPNAKVELYRSTDPLAILDPADPSWVLVTTLSDVVQSGVEQPTIGVTSNTLAMMIIIYSSDDFGDSPEFQRGAVRAFPKHRDWIIEIPINISDYVEVPFRAPLHVPGLGDMIYQQLVEQQGESCEMRLLDVPTTLRGVVDQIAVPVTYMSNRGSQGRLSLMRFRGNRIVSSEEIASPQGTTGLGIGTLGIAMLGVDT